MKVSFKKRVAIIDTIIGWVLYSKDAVPAFIYCIPIYKKPNSTAAIIPRRNAVKILVESMNLNLETTMAKNEIAPPIKYRKLANIIGVPQLKPNLITIKSDAMTNVSKEDNARNLKLLFSTVDLHNNIIHININ